MRKALGMALLAALVLVGGFTLTINPVKADSTCYMPIAATPQPIGVTNLTFPKCPNNILQVQSVDGGGTPLPAAPTPIPFPTGYPGFQNSSGVTLGVACDKSMAVNSTTTGSTPVSIIPNVGGKTTYICGYALYPSVTSSSTVTFEFGSHISSACDTAPTNLSGAIFLTTGMELKNGDGASSLFLGQVNREFCMVVTGTGTSIQGYVTYAQF